jgi:hypothetical protein
MYGYSDDLVEAEGIEGCDEFNAWSDDGIVAARFQVAAAEGQLEIIAVYNNAWGFAVLQTAEEQPLPKWPVFVSQAKNSLNENGPHYSTLLEINCPDDAVLSRIDKEE